MKVVRINVHLISWPRIDPNERPSSCRQGFDDSHNRRYSYGLYTREMLGSLGELKFEVPIKRNICGAHFVTQS